MNPHELVFIKIIHVVSILVLTGFTFMAFAAAPETRKRMMMVTGIFTLLVLLTGFRMWQGLYGLAPMGWIFVKLACWLVFSFLAGMAYRRRDKAAMLILTGVVLLTIAATMVYTKPF